jgi:hypothetical protein
MRHAKVRSGTSLSQSILPTIPRLPSPSCMGRSQFPAPPMARMASTEDRQPDLQYWLFACIQVCTAVPMAVRGFGAEICRASQPTHTKWGARVDQDNIDPNLGDGVPDARRKSPSPSGTTPPWLPRALLARASETTRLVWIPHESDPGLDFACVTRALVSCRL